MTRKKRDGRNKPQTNARDGRGRWKKGRSGNISGRPKVVPVGESFAEAVTDRANIPKLVRATLERAYDGELPIIKSVVDMIQTTTARRARTAPESMNYSNLSINEMRMLLAIQHKRRGDPITAEDLKWLAKINPPALVVDEIESDEPEPMELDAVEPMDVAAEVAEIVRQPQKPQPGHLVIDNDDPALLRNQEAREQERVKEYLEGEARRFGNNGGGFDHTSGLRRAHGDRWNHDSEWKN